MPVSTRKRKAAALTPTTQPEAHDLKNPSSTTTKVSSSAIEYKDDDPFYKVFEESSNSEADSDFSDYATSKRRKKARTIVKRRRSSKKGPGPAPEAPDMSDHELGASDCDTPPATKTRGTSISTAVGNSNYFNNIHVPIPQASSVLNLSLGDLLGKLGVHLNIPSLITATISSSERGVTRIHQDLNETLAKEGFFRLPRELRDKVYYHVFAAAGPIALKSREHMQNSGQVLRTCKQMAEEGAVVLYGQNSFHFARISERRGTYRDLVWKEIGFKDVRRFLSDIGPSNIGLLKYVSFALEDAAPYYTPYLTHVERMYVNDPVLLEIFRMIGECTVLRKLAISFEGRAQVIAKNFHFLLALGGVKCNTFFNAKQTYGAGKIEGTSLQTLKSVIVVRKGAENIDESKVKPVPMFYGKPKKEIYTFKQ
jgi:hypothetical protein